MLRDVFYFGNKPNVHPREKSAISLEDARRQATTEHFWIINEFCDYINFNWDYDFDILPDEDTWTKEHNNVWPCQWDKDSGTMLCPKEHTDSFLYRGEIEPIYRKNEPNSNWKILQDIDLTVFDFSWIPEPYEPPYIYTWGNKYIPAEIQPSLEYHTPEATNRKYVGMVQMKPEWERWSILVPIYKDSFDFTWRPDPLDPPLIYVFGNKWNDSATEPTLEYSVPGATQRKYMDFVVATPLPQMEHWTINEPTDKDTFDFSWRPNPHSPPQLYQWSNNGPCYSMPDTSDVMLMEYTDKNRVSLVNRYKIQTTIEALIEEHPNEVFWALNPDLTYERFDFTWQPDDTNFRHVNVFGNEYSKNTQTYYINGPMYQLGHREFNYIEDQSLLIESNLSMFYIDRNNSAGKDRYEQLKQRYPQLQKTRYLNSWIDTIKRCCNRSETKLFWVLNSELDYTNFNFDFYPSPWQINMVHVFGTQWSHWGNTYVVNRETFEESSKYIATIEHLNSLNFIKSKRAKAVECLYEIILIDHGNDNSVKELLEHKSGWPVKTVAYNNNYINTLNEIGAMLPTCREYYVWVCSSICDYTNFDFSYICDPYTKQQLHVFPSDKQKFGDTFLLDVNKLSTGLSGIARLEEFDKVNYNKHQIVKRYNAPIFDIQTDTHCDSINVDYNFPYAIFRTEVIDIIDDEPMNLWETDTKTITVTSAGGTRIVVPKEAKDYVKKELYDYPYVQRNDKLAASAPLDIIFLSNGEEIADINYEHLLRLTEKLPNRVLRINGVDGRVKSQHAAANASDSSWYFLVNAKLKVNSNFDFAWQPDRLQIPKHYIFTASNPLNGLEYGHQAMVANNKKLTLTTEIKGLDFTLDSEHEVVDINSGIGMFNASPWDTWRTAFRETIKIKHYAVTSNDPVAIERLNVWTTQANGEYSDWCLGGSNEAIAYYEKVNGDLVELMKSYDWLWLRKYFDMVNSPK